MRLLPEKPVVAAIVLCLFSGCSSLQTIPGLKSLAFRKSDPSDPLADVHSKVSDGYKVAKRELKSADTTLLKFARWREEMGDHNEALDRYREILSDNPNSVDARLGIARIEYHTGRVHEAEEILKATARKHPQNVQVWLDMGRIQSERKEFGAAIQSLQKAVELDSSSQIARYELGLAFARGDRLDEARSHLAFAVGESAAFYNIGYVLQEAGRNQEAVHWFHRALDSYPDERTRTSTTQMLARLGHGNTPESGSRVADAPKLPGKVDLQLTSYEAWTEVPRLPADAAVPGSHAAARTRPSAGQSVHRAVPMTQHNSVQPTMATIPNGQTPQWQGPQSGATPSTGGAVGFSRVGQRVMSQQTREPQQWQRSQ